MIKFEELKKDPQFNMAFKRLGITPIEYSNVKSSGRWVPFSTSFNCNRETYIKGIGPYACGTILGNIEIVCFVGTYRISPSTERDLKYNIEFTKRCAQKNERFNPFWYKHLGQRINHGVYQCKFIDSDETFYLLRHEIQRIHEALNKCTPIDYTTMLCLDREYEFTDEIKEIRSESYTEWHNRYFFNHYMTLDEQKAYRAKIAQENMLKRKEETRKRKEEAKNRAALLPKRSRSLHVMLY